MKKSIALLIAICLVCLDLSIAYAWECEVTVGGPNTIKLGEQITLSAAGSPAGGSYSWSRTPNLVPNGSTATLTGFQPTYSEYIKVVGYYTSPKGKKCSDTKWLWACVCSLETIAGPAEAKIGEPVTLSTTADPGGGSYTWTIESGSGTLKSNGASATFTGNQAGTAEIKASYTSPEGGEPCTKYHIIEISEDCQVSLTGDMYQRPVCRPVKFNAKGVPDSGQCTWSPSVDFAVNGCSATYNGTVAGYYTVMTTYTTPNGSTCEDSKGILSYALVDNMTPRKKCYISGTSLSTSDFNISTSPAGHSENAILTPTTVSTSSKIKDVPVTAKLLCDEDPNPVSTMITVVNENKKTDISINVEVPNYFKKPLIAVGLAEKLSLAITSKFSIFNRCCNEYVAQSTSGNTTVKLALKAGPFTIFGLFPMPASLKEYITLDALNASFSGNGNVNLNGNFYGCIKTTTWNGKGEIKAELEAGGEVAAKIKNTVILQGEVKGKTGISEYLEAKNVDLYISSKWDGLTVNNTISIITPLGDLKIDPVSYELIKPGPLKSHNPISLPSLNL